MTEETTIDWNAPLEAYHPGGKVVELAWARPTYEDDLCFNVHPSVDGHWTFLPNGRHYANETKWRIRNRKPAVLDRAAQTMLDAAKAGGAQFKPTASEHPEYSPELVAFERIKGIRCEFEAADLDEGEAMSAICAILSELDKSKEDRRLEAEALAIVLADETTRTDRQEQAIRDGRAGQSKRAIALAALRRGMELAKDEAA